MFVSIGINIFLLEAGRESRRLNHTEDGGKKMVPLVRYSLKATNLYVYQGS